jgi:hypothetical protein
MSRITTIVPVALLAPLSAFAQSTDAPAATSPLKATLFGNVKGKSTLVDSTRADTPDFNIDDLNLGVNASKGIGFGQLKLNSSPTGTISVKEAHAYLEHQDVSLGFGRFDTGIYDANRTVDDTRRMDAVRAGYTIRNSPTRALTLKGYYGRTFEGSANYADTKLATQWRAFGASLEKSFDGFFFRMWGGIEENRLASTTITTTINGDSTDTTVYSVAPWSSARFEAGYDAGVLSAKVFWIESQLGKAKVVKADKGTHQYKTVGTAQGMESGYRMVGLDVSGNSELWGMKDIVMPEDKLTYGATWVNTFEEVGTADNTNNKASLRAGYSTGALSTTLEFETHAADEKIWLDSKGKSSKSKNILSLAMDIGF